MVRRPADPPSMRSAAKLLPANGQSIRNWLPSSMRLRIFGLDNRPALEAAWLADDTPPFETISSPTRD